MKPSDANSNSKAEKPESFPHVRIKWTKEELQHLAEVLESEPAKPPEGLIRAMRARQVDTD